jgi:hypothetical protein
VIHSVWGGRLKVMQPFNTFGLIVTGGNCNFLRETCVVASCRNSASKVFVDFVFCGTETVKVDLYNYINVAQENIWT